MPPLAEMPDEELWYWLGLFGARTKAILETLKARYPEVPYFQLDIWNHNRSREALKHTEAEVVRWKETYAKAG